MALNDHASRAHATLSASSSDRWLKCPPSALAAKMYPSTSTVFTREGTLAHEVAEDMARGAMIDISARPEITTEMLRCAEAYADYIQEQITSDSATVLLEQRLDFSPWVPGGFGTGDCLILQGRQLHVIDYKYGSGVMVSAVENSQMRLYGLGAYNDFGAIYDIEEVVLHIFQPRMNNVSVEKLSRAELLAWGEEVKPVAALAAKGEGEMCSGAHCRFCPHAGSCPKLAADSMKVFDLYGVQAQVPSLLPWQVADILKAEPMVTAWLKSVKERALAGMLKGEEIPGYKVVEGRGSREWADELAVEAALDRAAVPREDTHTAPQLLSPYALEKSIGKKKATELVGSMIVSKPGAPTVAPASDKRKPFDRLAEARKDFV